MRTFTTHKDRIALIVAFAAILAQPGVKAQSTGTAVIADIPFAFQIDSHHLPAGKYELETEGSHVLLVKGNTASGITLVMSDQLKEPSTKSAVVFYRYGNQYFLREVHKAGSEETLWADETRAERRAKLELEASNPNSEPRADSKVEVALLSLPR